MMHSPGAFLYAEVPMPFEEWATIAARYDTPMACAMLRALMPYCDVCRIVGRCRRERRIYSGLMDCFRNHVSPIDWFDSHHRRGTMDRGGHEA